MRAVAERLVDGTAAAAKREICFSGQIILLAIGVYELDRAFRSVHAERPVFSRHDFNLRHQFASGGVMNFNSIQRRSLRLLKADQSWSPHKDGCQPSRPSVRV